MAKWNTEFYQNEIEYSDGYIENELLIMAREYDSYDEIISKDSRWPIVYHLSHLRHNILNWYPFEKNGTLLEVGSGCGALTGLFCEKVDKVISVELTRRRALINYERNKKYNNLEIMVGNLNNMVFADRFDYIILNGVFEYAINFTKTENPYLDFLNTLKGLLKPNGIILIAIENRLGLKYFAGAKEDHTGKFFSGLNEYEGIDYVRTFSKIELEELAKKAGFIEVDFYYPHPDYKFPITIHTDKSLDLIEYGDNYATYDAERFVFFDEHLINKTLIKEGIASHFANSFLVEMRLQVKVNKEKVIYAKMSNDRDEKYRILTKVMEIDGQIEVRKYALSEKAKEHLKNMVIAYKKGNAHGGFKYIPIKEKKDYVVFPFLKAKTMNDLLLENLNSGNILSFKNILIKFYNKMAENTVLTSEYHNSLFEEVFGTKKMGKPLLCCKFSNIDLLFENVFIICDKYFVIDYEWTFPFMVPIEYILWRSLGIFYWKNKNIKDKFSLDELFDIVNIKKEYISVFQKWDINFSSKHVNYNTMAAFEKKHYIPSLDIMLDISKEDYEFVSCLYIDSGKGYTEEQKVISKAELRGKSFKVKFYIHKQQIQKLRWDPLEGKFCRCKIDSIKSDGKNVEIGISNAWRNIDGKDEFLTVDPIYELKGDFIDASFVQIEGEIELLNSYQFQASLTDFILEKENQLSSHKSDLTKLKKELKVKHAELYKVQSEHHELIVVLNKAVAKRDDQIIALNQAVAERDDRIILLKQKMSELDHQLTSTEAAFNEVSHLSAQRAEIIDKLNNDLERIKSMWIVRIAKFLRVKN